MKTVKIAQEFSVNEKVVAITGGAGVLGSEIACSLAENGATVALLDLKNELSKEVSERLKKAKAPYAVLQCDVLSRQSIQNALKAILSRFGRVDVLINGAGGNHPKATTGETMAFYDLPQDAFDWVLRLNLMGTVLPSQVFGRYFASQKKGVILNISSMNAFRPLTRIPAYSAAKAAVSNFTQWLAVHMAQEYSPQIRVNAIAPGFFLTQQNRYLLLDEQSGALTQRGEQILHHTPLGRFGEPHDLLGAIIWLISGASSFVTGIVVPVDGGFSAYSGV